MTSLLNGLRPGLYPILPPRHAATVVALRGQIVSRVANEQMARLAMQIVTLLNQGRDRTKPLVKVRILAVRGEDGRPYYFIQRTGW